MTSQRWTTFVAAALIAALPLHAGTPAPLPRDSLYALSVPLTDAQGRTADWTTLRGKPRIVAMFYTSCQYMCPLIVESAKSVERALPEAERSNIGVVLISLHPAKDTPAALRGMATARHVDAAKWWLTSPRPADVRKVAGLLGVRYRALEDGNFNHTSALVLLDRDGRIVARTERMGSVPDAAFVAEVKKQAQR
jgi:protein SCO1